MEIAYVSLTESLRLIHADGVMAMMAALYEEDPSAHQPGRQNFEATLARLVAEPVIGEIVLFLDENQLAGYAILLRLWSNEFGGPLLLVDELYVAQAARGKGIGRGFFEWIARVRPGGAVALMLEVTHGNVRARAFYERLGFRPRANELMIQRLR